MNNNYHFEMPYENNSNNRSPQSMRVSRQASRPNFDAYAHLPTGLYAPDDAQQRYDNTFNGARNATIGGYGNNAFDLGGGSWNAGAFGNNHTMNGKMGGMTGTRRNQSTGRPGLPSVWLDQPPPMPANPYSPFGGFQGQRRDEVDEELIPTAIVIKNIPFAVKKEQLVQIMTDMGLPLPYAFNYHFDNGVFRGLAFANFTNPDETAAVIESLNHFELHGRKLRVEYKKMLPAAERERIEREKRERRGQLEEQHRPMQPSALHTQTSMSSLSSHMPAVSPSPGSARSAKPNGSFALPYGSDRTPAEADFDLNDPQVLRFYSSLLLFKEDPMKDVLPLPPTLSPPERRIVHTLAHHMGLGHASKGQGEQRAVHVFKETRRVSPPMPHILALQGGRQLNRAATTDFSDVRGADNFYTAGVRHQGSGYLGAYQDGGSHLGPGASGLRAAKSFADLRSYTPSPVPSTASFPTTLGNNVARMQEYNREINQSLTPTLMTPNSNLNDRNEASLINGLGNMNIGSGFGGSPRGLRGFPSWENPGPIGGHRSFSTNFEDRNQARGAGQSGPERQPRGPLPERGAGFPRRQNGHLTRNSDELSQQSSAPEITVEH
ncbi:hypothetical protein B0A48_10091 [Cryoendolithus antarcticus]|uniref:RRM domain-containing protein n=1 Tax=Cryoendolithus antarcticus TaxID=1507870 RepID=A0A1V8SWS3_9PEZI|nr:hypothetical protein B0A48_10091 [Cryoendolithus antarcticus]